MSNSLQINTPKIVQQNTPLRGVPSGSTAEQGNNVKYVPQTLTEEQQAQARQNIGAAAAGSGGEQIQSDWTQTDDTKVDYIKHKPNLATVATSGNYNDLTNKPSIPAAQVQSDWTQSDDTKVDYIKNKPTIPAAQVNADWNASSGVAQILNKPTIPAAQIQSDWNQTDTAAADYIKNKPEVGESFDWGDMDYSWELGFSNCPTKNIDGIEYSVAEVLRVTGDNYADTVKWVVANGSTVLKKAANIADGDPVTHLNANEYAWMEMYGGWHLCVCARDSSKAPMQTADNSPNYLGVNVRLTVHDWNRDYCDRGRVKIFKCPKRRTSADNGTHIHYNGIGDDNFHDLSYQAGTLILSEGFTTNVGFAGTRCTTFVYNTYGQLYTATISSPTVTTVIFNSAYYTRQDNCSAVTSSNVTTVWWLREGYNKIIADDRFHDYQSKIHPFDFLVFNNDGSVTPIVLPQAQS